MSNPNKSSSSKKTNKANPLEIVRDFSNEIIKPISQEAISQIFGEKTAHFKGEIYPGESLEISEVMSGRREQKENEQKSQILFNKLEKEERSLIEKRTGELKIEIQAIHKEIVEVAREMPQLERQVQIAAFQTPTSFGIADLFFLQSILKKIRDFRTHIHDARVWLEAANQRSAKKNRWGSNYKKSGAKYLLSGEHYLTRSAG